MEVTTSRLDDAMVASVSGRIDSSTAAAFQEKLLFALGAAGNCLLLDCKRLAYMSSAGLRTLLMAIKQADRGGGVLVLVRVPARIREVLDVSGFTRFTKLFDTFEEAQTHLSRA